MTESDQQLASKIVESSRRVHRILGPGFVESIYARALGTELKARGHQLEHEKLIRVWYGSQVVGRHKLDLLVDGSAIVELKASRGIIPVYKAQLESYLHATTCPFGLILNFGNPVLEYELISRVHEEAG